MYGLKEETVSDIKAVFAGCKDIETVILYGSRAKGNYKKGSDIDLTLTGNNLCSDIVFKVDRLIEELYLAYTFDISIFANIRNQSLIDHIERVGIVFYEREQSQLK